MVRHVSSRRCGPHRRLRGDVGPCRRDPQAWLAVHGGWVRAHARTHAHAGAMAPPRFTGPVASIRPRKRAGVTPCSCRQGRARARAARHGRQRPRPRGGHVEPHLVAAHRGDAADREEVVVPAAAVRIVTRRQRDPVAFGPVHRSGMAAVAADDLHVFANLRGGPCRSWACPSAAAGSRARRRLARERSGPAEDASAPGLAGLRPSAADRLGRPIALRDDMTEADLPGTSPRSRASTRRRGRPPPAATRIGCPGRTLGRTVRVRRCIIPGGSGRPARPIGTGRVHACLHRESGPPTGLMPRRTVGPGRVPLVAAPRR